MLCDVSQGESESSERAHVRSALSAVKVIGALAVPSATMVPPFSTIIAGARPAVSSGVAWMVTPGWMLSVAPARTTIWQASK